MRRHWKHLIGFALCGGAVGIIYAVAVGMSFADLSPDGPPTDQQRQTSARGHGMEDVLLVPGQWLFGDSIATYIFSWVVWSGLLYLLFYSLGRLVYGTHRKRGA